MLQLTVLVSGNGSNLQVLIDAAESGEPEGFRIAGVVADRPCRALERAEKHGIKHCRLSRKNEGNNLSAALLRHIPEETDYVLMAGFLSILSADFIRSFRGRILNIHPSLLPAYGGKGMYGDYVHKAVLAQGETRSGVSVHRVDEGIDTGPVILQRAVSVSPGETVESLRRKVQKEEHLILPEVIRRLIREQEESKRKDATE